MMTTTCFKLGYADGYANRPAKSQSPEYMDGYRSGQDDRWHEKLYWAEENTLSAWGMGR
jgi:hypothetical protein